jgi:signal transduction histidine kinase/CheY-like chemotaxis protein
MPDASVLIVDDDRTIVRLCQSLLERASFRVIATLDPSDALNVLAQQKVDLLLSDIRMPVMDGFELIARAKEYQPELSVLVMTGFGSADTAIQALHRGVDGLILKPFENSSDLVQAVQRVLEQTRQKRDAARLQVLRPLFDVTAALLAETSSQSVEKLITDAITGLFQACYAGIYRLVMPDDRLEVVRAVTGDLVDQQSSCAQLHLIKMALAAGPDLLLNATGPGDQALQTIVKELGFEGIMVSVVRRNEHQFLFFAARPSVDQPFTQVDHEMFAILARQSTVAIENARLYTQLMNNVLQVEESQRALINAEKMAAVGRLMASLAHEINNPLQAVRNCLHLAARRDINQEQRLHYLELTDSEMDRLVNTVRRMLDFSHTSNIEQEDLNIQVIMDRILGLVEPQLRSQNIAVHLSYQGRATTIKGVPGQIQQVFLNLLMNSVDAMDALSENKHIWLEIVFEEKQIVFRVENSGTPLTEELPEHNFEPLSSTKTNGTVPGLSVTYGIIERHGGKMVVGTPGHHHGTCIEVTLPVFFEGGNV